MKNPAVACTSHFVLSRLQCWLWSSRRVNSFVCSLGMRRGLRLAWSQSWLVISCNMAACTFAVGAQTVSAFTTSLMKQIPNFTLSRKLWSCPRGTPTSHWLTPFGLRLTVLHLIRPMRTIALLSWAWQSVMMGGLCKWARHSQTPLVSIREFWRSDAQPSLAADGPLAALAAVG